MWTYSAINFAVTLAILLAGLAGFAGGWLAHRAAVRERRGPEEMDEPV